MSNVETIRSLIDELKIPLPDDPEDGMWMKPDRGSPNYFRLVPTNDEADEGLYFDVWVEAELTTDKSATHTLSITVGFYDGFHDCQVEEKEIVNRSFGHNEQPVQQTILNNWERAHRKNTKEKVTHYANWAEQELKYALEDSGSN